jgi:hypothetical protein
MYAKNQVISSHTSSGRPISFPLALFVLQDKNVSRFSSEMHKSLNNVWMG